MTVPFVCACGRCPECRSGNAQVCRNQTQPGFTHDGSFAELVAIHEADHNLIRVSDDLDAGAAALLGCRFATAYRGLVHARPAAARRDRPGAGMRRRRAQRRDDRDRPGRAGDRGGRRPAGAGPGRGGGRRSDHQQPWPDCRGVRRRGADSQTGRRPGDGRRPRPRRPARRGRPFALRPRPARPDRPASRRTGRADLPGDQPRSSACSAATDWPPATIPACSSWSPPAGYARRTWSPATIGLDDVPAAIVAMAAGESPAGVTIIRP